MIEADEYDTAFFDKRPKFMHYRPCGAALNNLEFDHADIYANVGEIARQFHYLLRTIPPDGRIAARAGNENILRAMEMGVYTPVDFFGDADCGEVRWRWRMDGGMMEVLDFGEMRARFSPPLAGAMNRDNVLAALALADWAGAGVEQAGEFLGDFSAPLRRMQFLGEWGGIRIYDDFAHHPTAYAETIRALREENPGRRVIAVFEPRSNTMKAGVFRGTLRDSLSGADVVVGCESGAEWSLAEALGDGGDAVADANAALARILEIAREGDCILLMSNGAFGGLPRKVSDALKQRTETKARKR